MWSVELGKAGWLRWESSDWPGSVYLRFCPNERGRWSLREMFVDSEGSDAITQTVIARVPLADLEALVNGEWNGHMVARFDHLCAVGGPTDASNMAVLASWMNASFGRGSHPDRHWVAAANYSVLPKAIRQDGGRPEVAALETVKKRARQHERIDLDSEYHLDAPPGEDGLSDEFLGKVARAYSAAIMRGESPNRAIADDIQHQKTRTVERWVYEARKRGIMSPGRKGARG